MNIGRIWAMFVARNYEFFRDKAAFGWNLAFPFLIIVGFGLIFGDKNIEKFKVGVFPAENSAAMETVVSLPERLQSQPRFVFIGLKDKAEGELLLKRHRIDLLISLEAPLHDYWINDSSPSGYLAEQIYLASFIEDPALFARKGVVEGEQVRYVDWFFPGLMGMNMMFSALWGVGYVVVRYRKNGALKRLKATPLTALEYITAQMLSRLFLMMFTLVVVWVGADLIFDFHVQGSYLLIFFLFFIGCLSLCSLGLVLAARGTSEEFASGALNFISWPMMFLSEVWFSLEGSPAWIQQLSQFFPLTHMLRAIRQVMNEGAGFVQVQQECYIMILFSVIALGLAAWMFSWNE